MPFGAPAAARAACGQVPRLLHRKQADAVGQLASAAASQNLQFTAPSAEPKRPRGQHQEEVCLAPVSGAPGSATDPAELVRAALDLGGDIKNFEEQWELIAAAEAVAAAGGMDGELRELCRVTAEQARESPAKYLVLAGGLQLRLRKHLDLELADELLGGAMLKALSEEDPIAAFSTHMKLRGPPGTESAADMNQERFGIGATELLARLLAEVPVSASGSPRLRDIPPELTRAAHWAVQFRLQVPGLTLRLRGWKQWYLHAQAVRGRAEEELQLLRDVTEWGEQAAAEEPWRRQHARCICRFLAHTLTSQHKTRVLKPDRRGTLRNVHLRHECYPSRSVQEYVQLGGPVTLEELGCTKRLVRNANQVRRATRHWLRIVPSVIGIDQETAMFGQSVGLVQVSCGRTAVLFDIPALAANREGKAAADAVLGRLLSSPLTLKVGSDPDRDLIHLRKMLPDWKCFTSDAHGVVNFTQLFADINPWYSSKGRLLGLANATAYALNRVLDKTVQVSDWSARPLSEAQLEYAALDAAVVLHIARLLARQLRQLRGATVLEKEKQEFDGTWSPEDLAVLRHYAVTIGPSATQLGGPADGAQPPPPLPPQPPHLGSASGSALPPPCSMVRRWGPPPWLPAGWGAPPGSLRRLRHAPHAWESRAA
eukprot:TRINITY_DN44001_c0_g1_i1.p1 TRINITY_DN44001_c0_g1~~TRINITY_DN44001_c0_g1_i1.p1  ORF type:complete len:655 (+),score=143.99 TRINITY_DN44001_c0_g1_i1:91-2055(+)